MSGITVVLDRKQLVVRIESGALRIDKPGARPERIPLNMVDRMIVRGSPMVSCDVWRKLAEKNIPALLMPSRGTGAIAYLGAGLSENVLRRMAQYRTVFDENLSLDIAKRLVTKKLDGQARVAAELKGGIPEMFAAYAETRKQAVTEADSRDALMGVEGAAAAFYFRSLSQILPEKWGFNGRNRRPPRDPVNALLSLTYVIVGSDILRTLREKGLDPSLGFLHAPKTGRDSLMLDILEPVRPLIDRFVLRLVKNTLTPDDFRTNEQDGCRLRKKGRSLYYNALAEWTESE